MPPGCSTASRGCSLRRAAKIGTYLDQVVDAFHVTAADGAKVTGVGRQAAIRAAIETAAAPVTGPV